MPHNFIPQMARFLRAIFFLLCCLPLVGQASHLRGGDLTYRNLGGSTYEITAVIYRDCLSGNVPLSTSYPFGIYFTSSGTLHTTVNIPQVSISTLAGYAPNCNYPPSVCVQEGIYRDTVTLPTTFAASQGFVISMEAFARNNIVDNLVDGQSMYWVAQIPASLFTNSSVYFLAKPVPYVCLGKPVSFSQNAFDTDGDSLAFSLVAPYGDNVGGVNGAAGGPGPHPSAAYAGGFSSANPLGVGTPIAINPITGEITFVPNSIGVYVIAVEVEEWRLTTTGSALSMGKVRRDIQFVVGNTCTANTPPFVDTTVSALSYQVVAGGSFNFTLQLSDTSAATDSINGYAFGPMFSSIYGLPGPYATLNFTPGVGSATAQFQWSTNCAQARSQPYYFTLVAYDNQCNERQTSIAVTVRPRTVVRPPTLRCLRVQGSSSVQLEWTPPAIVNNFNRYYIYRSSTSATTGFTLIDSVTGSATTTYTDASATNAFNQAYWYRVASTNTCFVIGTFSTTLQTIRLQAFPHVPSNGWVTLQWNTMTGSGTYNGVYTVQRRNGTTGPWTNIGTTTSTLFTTRLCNLNGQFRVELQSNNFPCTSLSAPLSVMVSDNSAPQAPGLRTASISGTTVTVTFAKSDSTDVQSYALEGSNNGVTFTQVATVNANGNASQSMTDPTANAFSGARYYRVKASDTCGNVGSSAVHRAIHLTASPGQNRVSLSWNHYLGLSPRTGYTVQRKNATNWQNVASFGPNDSTFVDSVSILCGVANVYRIRVSGTSALGNANAFSDSAAVTPFDTVAPLAPQIRYITVGPPPLNRATIVYEPSASTDVNRYQVHYSTSSGVFNQASGSAIDSGGPAPLRHSFTTLNGRDYRLQFKFKSIDSCALNLSPFSNMHALVRLTTTNNLQLAIRVRWTKYWGRPVSQYRLMRRRTTGAWQHIGFFTPSDTLYFDTVGQVCNVPYFYRITTFFASSTDTALSGELSGTPVDIIPPDAPILLSASVQSDTLMLKVLRPQAADVAFYEAYFYEGGIGPLLGNFVNSPGLGFDTVYVPLPGMLTADEVICGEVLAKDSCASGASPRTSKHCAMLLETTPANLSADLSWTPYVGFDSIMHYEIERKFVLTGQPFIQRAILPPTQTTFTDTGLLCNTPYVYRVRAVELGGYSQWSYSNVDTVEAFDTTTPQPAFIQYATVTGPTTVRIFFNKSSSKSVKNYQIFYSKNGTTVLAGQFFASPSGANPVSIVQGTLATELEYYTFFLRAFDSCSNANSSASVPHGPVQLEGTPGNRTSKLNWYPYVGWTPERYIVQRKSPIGIWVNIDTVPPTDTTYLDTANIECATGYLYRILTEAQALDGGWVSVSDSVQVIPYDSTYPPNVQIKNASIVSNNRISIEWRNVNSSRVKFYRVELRTGTGPWVTVAIRPQLTGPADSVLGYVYPVNLSNANGYCVRVRALDSCSNLGSLNSQSFCLNNIAVTASNTSNKLAWTGLSGTSSWPVNGYVVQRLSSGVWLPLDTVPGTQLSYVDTPLACGVFQKYRLLAIDSSAYARTSFSDTAGATPFDTVPPPVPQWLAVNALSATSVEVTWDSVPDGDLDGYRFFRMAGTTVVQINNRPPGVTTFVDNSYVAGRCYQVNSFDTCATNFSARAPLLCPIIPSVTQLFCNRRVNLTWNSPSELSSPLTSFVIERRSSPLAAGGPFTKLDTVFAPTLSYYIDTSVVFGATYTYRIVGFASTHSLPSSSLPIEIIVDTVQAPTIRVASVTTSSPTAGVTQLTWPNAAGLNHASSLTLYHAEGNNALAPLAVNLPLSQNTFAHSGINTASATHRYLLALNDSCGNQSDTLSALAHQTINLSAIGGQVVHNLSWTPYLGWPQGVRSYGIYQIDNGVNVLIDTVPGSSLSRTIRPAPCNRDIFYVIRALGFNQGEISFSDTAKLDVIDTIPAVGVDLLNVTVTQPTCATITFASTDTFDIWAYSVERSLNGGPFTHLNYIIYGGPNQTYTYLDTVNTYNNRICYRVVTYDSCLNATPSDTFCLIQLQAIGGQRAANLTWQPFVGWPVDEYVIQQRQGTTWVSIDSIAGTDTSYIHLNQICNVAQRYRIVAQGFPDPGFTTYLTSTSDTSFATPFDTVPPADVVINYATVASGSTVSVGWNLSDGDVKRYELWVQPNGGPWRRRAILNGTPTSGIITGLAPADTAYCIAVIAADSCALNTSTFVTAHCLIPLSAPPINQGVSLSWQPYVGFSNPSAYQLQKRLGGVWTNLATVPQGTTAYLDTPLPCGQLNVYRILISETVAGITYTTLSDSARAIPFDTVAPNTPTIVVASIDSSDKIMLRWRLPQEPDAVSVEVQVRSSGTPYVTVATIPLPDTTLTINNLATRDSLYSIRIRVVDSCGGNTSAYSALHRAILLSGTPGQVSATLNWTSYVGFTAISGAPATPIRYIIQRFNVPTQTWVPVDSVLGNTTTWTGTGLVCGVQTTFRVVARSRNGSLGLLAASDSVGIMPFDTIPPGPVTLHYATVVPAGSSSSAGNVSTVHLAWSTPPADAGFIEVYGDDGTGTFTLLATIPATNGTYIDTPVDANLSRLCYRVVVVDSCNQNLLSTASNIQCTSTLRAGTRGCTPLVKLYWNPHSVFTAGLNSYQVFRRLGSSGAETLLATVPASDTTYTDNTVSLATLYSYRIVARSLGSPVYTSSTDSVLIEPLLAVAPLPIAIRSASVLSTSPATGQINVRWYPYGHPLATVANDTAARGYRIYRANTSAGPWALVGTVTNLADSQLVISGLNTQTGTNWFQIRVYNSCGLESDSFPNIASHRAINLTLTPLNAAAQLNWSAYVGRPTYSYTLQRSSNGAPFIDLSSGLTTTTFTDTSVRCGVGYAYRVLASGAQSPSLTWVDSAFSDTESFLAYDSIPPAAAGVLRATVTVSSTTVGSVLVEITPPAELNLRGYQVYRAVNGGAAVPALWVNPNQGTQSYSDNLLNTLSNTYSYFFRALDSCTTLEGPASETHTTMNLTAVAQNDYNQLTWNAYQGFTTWNCSILRRTTNAAWDTIAFNLPQASVAYSDSAVKCNTLYTYRVVAFEQGGASAAQWSSSDTARARAFETNAPATPTILSASVNGSSSTAGSVELRWVPSSSTDVAGYQILRKGLGATGGLTVVGTTGPSASTFVGALNTLDTSYAFALVPFDSCGNVQPASSAPHATIRLRATPGNERVFLNWTAYRGRPVTSYQIERDGSVITTLNGSDTSFTDLGVICPLVYTYRIVAVTDTPFALSNTDEASPFDTTPPNPGTISASRAWPNEPVHVYYTLPVTPQIDAVRLILYRSDNGQVYNLIADIALTPGTVSDSFIDPTAVLGPNTYCYYAVSIDGCSNISLKTNLACPVSLQAAPAPAETPIASSIRLTWSAYVDWPTTALNPNYTVWRSDSAGAEYQKIATLPLSSTAYLDSLIPSNTIGICYEVRAEAGNGAPWVSLSNIACADAPIRILMPNAFTPSHSQGLNDTWQPIVVGAVRVKVDLYSRWGQLMWSSDGPTAEPFDGKLRDGTPLSQGLYQVVVTAYTRAGDPTTYRGTLTILR